MQKCRMFVRDSLVRVFRVPEVFPTDYCFQGGHDVPFRLLDWFNAAPGYGVLPGCEEGESGAIHLVDEDAYLTSLEEFLGKKRYVQEGGLFLVLFDFGLSHVFGAPRP